MKLSDHFIARDFSLGAAEHFEGAVAREIRGFAGSLFDCRDEFGVESQAFSSERNQRRSLRRIRTRSQHSGSGPGSFAARFLAIQHRHAQFFGRKLEGDRATDQSAANDDYVVSAHRFILSGIAARILRSRAARQGRSQSGINTAAGGGNAATKASEHDLSGFWPLLKTESDLFCIIRRGLVPNDSGADEVRFVRSRLNSVRTGFDSLIFPYRVFNRARVRTSNQRESTSSTERRRAFWARVWARDQSPALPASSDWARKLRIFSCRSSWAAFRTLPLACCKFFWATFTSSPVLWRMLA